MAHGSSFSFDASGLVTDVRNAEGAALDGDAVGQSALRALQSILEASESGGSPVVQFDAWRGDGETVISTLDSAASPQAARVQSAYVPSTFENVLAGLELYDTDLRVLRSNPAALAIRGARSEDVLGRTAVELDHQLPLSSLLVAAMAPARAAGPEPVVARDVRTGLRVYSVLALPVREGSAVIGAAAIVHDVTESVRARDAERLLGAAHERVGSSLSMMQTAQELAAVATRDFADVVSVDLVEAVFHGDEAPFPPMAGTTPLRRAAFSSAIPFTSLYAIGEPSHFVFPTPYTQTLADMEPRLVDPRGSPSDWHMHDAERAGILRASDVHSMILAPLVQQGRVLGLVCLYRSGRRNATPFDRRDVGLAEQITARAAVHIENARRYVRELTTATTLQRSLLPRNLPEVPAVRTAHFWSPGGHRTHWLDVITLSGARVGLAMGHIPQQGLRASVDMGRFRTAFATLARMDLAPDELLVHMDDFAHTMRRDDPESPTDGTDGDGDGTRCLYAVYDSISGSCQLASADWPAPLVTGHDGTTAPVDMPIGPGLGHHSSYEVARVRLDPSALLTLYSPSLLRPAQGDDAFGLLQRAVSVSGGDAQVACDNIVYALMGDHGRQRGGGAVLTAAVRRLPAGSHVSWTAPRRPTAVADCRNRAREQLEAWHLDDQVFATEVVVSELVTNVLSHARGDPRVRLIRDDRLTVEVSDDSSTSPHLRHARAQDENGRGLLIAAALASRWGTRYGEDGKTIWVEQDLGG